MGPNYNMGPDGPVVGMGSLPTSLPRQQSQQTSVSEGAGSRTGSIRARRDREREQQAQQQGGAIPRHSSIGSAATTTTSLSSSRGSAGGAVAAVSRPPISRPSRPPRLSVPNRGVPGSSGSIREFREVVAAIPENHRVDAGTSTDGGVMQNRLEEAKTPTDSTGSSSESWFASLFRSASLR